MLPYLAVLAWFTQQGPAALQHKGPAIPADLTRTSLGSRLRGATGRSSYSKQTKFKVCLRQGSKVQTTKHTAVKTPFIPGSMSNCKIIIEEQ
jgi:hypothetical protein